jgi:hypothetical protein
MEQERQSAIMRSKRVVQSIPVYQPAYQFSVPHIERRRGWIAPDAQLGPFAGTVSPVQAPPVVYRNLKFLDQAGVYLPERKNRARILVQAPAIETTF